MPEHRPDDGIIDALRALPPVDPPAGARDRFMARVDLALSQAAPEAAGAPRWRRTAPWLLPLTAAAAALLWMRPTVPPIRSAPSEASRRQEVLALEAPSPRALSLLESRLREDPSEAVRVLSVDVLARLAPSEAVEGILTRAGASDPSPFVQASILTASRTLTADGTARVARALMRGGLLDESLRPEAEALGAFRPSP